MAEKKNKKDRKNGLTPRQKVFCDEYLSDLNGKRAAIEAGYSERSAAAIAAENLTKPKIRAYIDRRLAERDSELIAKQDEVMKYLTSVMRGESTAEEVVVEGTGVGCSEASTIKKGPSEIDRLKAADQLAKCYGLYNKDKINIEKQKLDIEKRRLELEERKTESAAPDKEIKVVIGGYRQEWSE